MSTAELIRAQKAGALVFVRLPHEGPAGHARIVSASGRAPADSPSRTVTVEFVQQLSQYYRPGRKLSVRPAECVRLSSEAEQREALSGRSREQAARDRFNTTLQQTGVATLLGMNAAELVNSLSELGIRLRDVRLRGTATVMDDDSRPDPDEAAEGTSSLSRIVGQDELDAVLGPDS